MRVALAIALIMIVGLPCAAGPVAGRVRLIGRAPGVTSPTIVYAEPLDGRRPQAGQFKMPQKNKAFFPRILAVPVGSRVSFPNEDPIFHNVFSLSRPNPFDLGLYRSGESKDIVFSKPAIYRVFCNIHPQMSGLILVLPTSYVTEADNAGAYRLDVPAGRYRITAWSERSEPSSIEVTVGAAAFSAADLSLDESKFVEVPHKNKHGQDYPKQ